MENHLVDTLNKVAAEPGTIGCVFANNHGLCIGNKGKSTAEAAGVITAIMNEAAKLGQNSTKSPVVSLDYGDKQCLIYRTNEVTGAIYRQQN